MDSTLSCMTDGHNIYTINKERKLLFLTHPDLAAHLYNETPAQDASDYYARKAAYLQKHGYTEGMHHQYDAKMTPEMVKDSLANLRQLVFEVTDACNLRCKYCGYGELYSDHDERHAQKMPFDTAKKTIDFLLEVWKDTKQEFTVKNLFVSFYGGEPLLNMPFIRQVIDYVESLHIAITLLSIP